MALLVSLNARAGHITICPDGEDALRARPAGVPFFSPEGERLRIRVSDETPDAIPGDTAQEACETLALDIEGADVLWIGPVPAADAARARSVPIAVVLQGIARADRFEVSEIEWLGGMAAAPPAPPALPRASGEADLPKDAPENHRPVPRSAWVWNPDAWKTRPESIWALAARERLTELFVTVPVAKEGESVEAPAALGGFLAAATARGLAVRAVAGDPRHVLPEALPSLLARVRAYADYNDAAPPDARLAGLQLDIEPYLLPGFALAPAYWRDRYLETFHAVRTALDGRLPLDMVVPVWWGGHEVWGEPVLRVLARPGVSLTVMNYRTRPEGLRAGALPFLEAGARLGMTVRMALETGPLPDEVRRVHRPVPPGTAGELWLLDGLSVPILMLLKTPRTGLPGRAYAVAETRDAPASNLTFGTARARREAVADSLVREWSGWPSFGGLALHGLDVETP